MSRVKLGDVAQEYKATVKDCSNLPIVGLEHLTPGEITLERWDEGTENTFTKGFKKGQMLFGRRRAYLKKAAVAPFDGVCSGDITVIEAISGKILPELLPFIIQNDLLFDYAVGKSAGSLSPRVKWVDLKDYEFELPEIEKQTSLVDLLKAAHATRKAYQEQIKATDDLVKSQFIEMFGDPNNNANTVSFETAFTIRDDLRKPINDSVRSEMHENAMYPYYGANGQVDTINQYLMDCTALCLAEDCGAYGAGEASSYIVSGKCWVNNHAHVIIPKECCDLHYANAFFKILDMTPYVSGSTRLKLTQGKMKEIPVVLPSIGEQMKFAAIVEQSDKSKFELQQAIEKVDNLIKSLIQQDNK